MRLILLQLATRWLATRRQADLIRGVRQDSMGTTSTTERWWCSRGLSKRTSLLNKENKENTVKGNSLQWRVANTNINKCVAKPGHNYIFTLLFKSSIPR